MKATRKGLMGIAAGSLYDNLRYLLFVAVVCITAAVLGYVRSTGDFGSIGVMVKGVEDLAVSIRSKPLHEQIAAVFFHNMRVIVIILGASWLPLIPVLAVMIMNSIMIGAMIAATSTATGIPPITIAVGLLPHGIFEIAAFFIAAAACLRIGMLVPLWLGKDIDGVFMKKALTAAVLSILLIVTPLMLVAAGIEVTFSSWLAEVLAR